jgi:hypothetical protein
MTTVKLIRDLMRGDVIRTPEGLLDPLDDANEHVVVEAFEHDGEFFVQVEPNPFEEHWRMNPRESIFVYREGAEVETPRTVVTDETLRASDDDDDPREAFAQARARLRALGYVLGAVRLDKFRPRDLIMLTGAGDLHEVETVDGQVVKFTNVEPAMRVDPSYAFLCLRPVKS